MGGAGRSECGANCRRVYTVTQPVVAGGLYCTDEDTGSQLAHLDSEACTGGECPTADTDAEAAPASLPLCDPIIVQVPVTRYGPPEQPPSTAAAAAAV